MTDTDPPFPRHPSRNRRPLRLFCSFAAVLAWLGSATAGGDAASGNRLRDSHDPYLLLHAHNPVDWYPWGPEALEKARRENKPIFLSIGYSTCYWCHVAEREIYSDPEIAKLMTAWFVNIKVDREQRPDLDRVYMLATQLITGHGGWPNNVFLTPDLKPFFAGSYFPPQDQDGRAGFPSILAGVHRAWSEDREKMLEMGESVYQALQEAEKSLSSAGTGTVEPRQWRERGVEKAAEGFDAVHGGFSGGGATMFPQSPLLSMLLQNPDEKAPGMATSTLEAMAEGGVMDQLAGGFHRYSTEPSWSVPHFEKMLNDNAQLLGLYAQAYALTHQPLFRQVALQTAHWLSAEMRAPEGGFFSAQDAEVDGVEGASYVWTHTQIESVLGKSGAKRFLALYALTPMPKAPAGHKQPTGGVLRLDRQTAGKLFKAHRLTAAMEDLAPLREKLLAARRKRPQPARDEKILTAWNALAIIGFAEAGQTLGDALLTSVALRAADWQWGQSFIPTTGALKHQFFQGHASGDGFLDDYALLGRAFMTLYRTTGDVLWQSRAEQLADALLKRFVRPDGSLSTAPEAADLLVAPPAEGDSVEPSGQSAAIALLLELAASTGDSRDGEAARGALEPLVAQVAVRPSGWGALLAALGQPKLAEALERAGKGKASRAASAGSLDSADHVHAQGTFQALQEGAEMVVTVEIDPGYHINANPASDPALIPTQLTLEGHTDLSVTYPESRVFKAPFAPQGIAVYEDRITLRARLPQGAASPPPAARLRVQACNDQSCLAPATLAVPVGGHPQ